MATIVDVNEAEAQLARVEKGEKIVLARNGKPCARLVPIAERSRELGFVEGKVPDGFSEPLPDDELDAWR